MLLLYLDKLIERLRAYRKKSWARTRAHVAELKDMTKGGPVNNGEQNSTGTISAEEATFEAERKKIREARDRNKQKRAERLDGIKEKNEQRREVYRQKREEFRKRHAAIDPGKKKVVHLVFMAAAASLAILFIGFDIWPASFFNDLEFQQKFSRHDLFVFLETSFCMLLFLMPVNIYVMKRLADKAEVKEPEDFNHDVVDEEEEELQ